MSSAWSHGTSRSDTSTLPVMVGSITTLRPLISAKVRSTARRSAPWKSSDTGCPVNRGPVGSAAAPWGVGVTFCAAGIGVAGACIAAGAAGAAGIAGSSAGVGAGAAAGTSGTAAGVGSATRVTTGVAGAAGVTTGAAATVAGAAAGSTAGAAAGVSAPKITRSSSPSTPPDSTRNGSLRFRSTTTRVTSGSTLLRATRTRVTSAWFTPRTAGTAARGGDAGEIEEHTRREVGGFLHGGRLQLAVADQGDGDLFA